MSTLRDLTIETLTHLSENGQEQLALDSEARSILRDWMLAARNGATTPATQPTPPPNTGKATHTTAPAPDSVEEKLAYLQMRAQNWKAARALGTLRDTMVFATGNPHARLMLVGEAPGYDEERLQEPFVGRAGQKLNQILAAANMAREEVYISNICKFRPAMGQNQGMSNRPPSDEEIAACLPLIMAEIRAIRPTCILCLGGTAAKGLLGSGASVSSLRGKWFDCQNIPVRVTYHPSYLLRNDSLTAKRAVWEDFLAVMEKLNLNITPRQRAFFLPA
ncbi:MAG: uracil-DNA glycosylase [Akkermansia sp.]|nr:uracil-DNA glycosylase [Akkermansia sp.]